MTENIDRDETLSDLLERIGQIIPLDDQTGPLMRSYLHIAFVSGAMWELQERRDATKETPS